MPARSLPAIASAIAVFLGGAAILTTQSFGALSGHMATHILVMNLIAPLLAAALVFLKAGSPARGLWPVALLQGVLLIAWHGPGIPALAAESPAAHAGLTATLVVAATVFWTMILATAVSAPWRAIAALMLTGKVACLLGALLVFAPRLLLSAHPSHGGPAGLEDQQLAGLLMISVCPLSYIVAGVVIAAQALSRLDDTASEGERLPPAPMPQRP
jgi:putative membrane protein